MQNSVVVTLASAIALISLAAAQDVSARLVQRAIRRVSEIELVARGYLLSDRLALATRLEQTQTHARRSAHIRRTLLRVLTATTAAHEQAQLQLLGGQSQLRNDVRSTEEDAVQSISEMKERAELLTRMRAATLSLLSSISAAPCALSTASTLSDTLLLLLASTREGSQLLENALPAPARICTQLATLPRASAAAPLRQLLHQLRSAEARVAAACEQSELDADALLAAHIDYIRRALRDAQHTCDQLAQQRPTSHHSRRPPPIPHPPRPESSRRTRTRGSWCCWVS